MVWFMENMLMLLSLGNHRRIRVFGYIALFSFLLKKANFEPTFDIHEPTTFAITLRMLIEQAKYRILHASGDVVPKLHQMWNHEKFQLTEFYSRPRYPSVCSRLVNETKDLMSCILHQITSTIPQQGLLSPQCQWGIRALGFTMQYYPEGYFFEFEKKVIQLSNENVLTRLTDLQLRLIIIGLFLVRALIMEILLEPQHLGFEAKPLMTEEENFRILASIFVYVYRIIVHDSELRMTRKFGLKFRPVVVSFLAFLGRLAPLQHPQTTELCDVSVVSQLVDFYFVSRSKWVSVSTGRLNDVRENHQKMINTTTSVTHKERIANSEQQRRTHQ
ncbi:hypothetical protein X801_09777, partial [Opisthorchis viverrini]